jgi:hypothetical protein
MSSVRVLDVFPWPRSTADRLSLEALVLGGQLSPAGDGPNPAWVVPPSSDQEPNPPPGYIVSFLRLHERGFNAPASKFMRGLCYHYGVELHNFAPNAISQAASFVAVCEGFLGIPAHWDLWVHFFRGELHTLATGERKVRRAVRAGGLTFSVRDSQRELYLPCSMTANNSDWEKGWFYLRNDGAGLPPYSGKVVKERPISWTHGVSPPSRQRRLEPLTNAISQMANAGLTVASVIANFHHRRVIPLMERELLIFEMTEEANPVALARSRLLEESLAWVYAATWARRAVNPKVVQSSDDDLWSFAMLPGAERVSVSLRLLLFSIAMLGLTVTAGCRGWRSMCLRRIRRRLGRRPTIAPSSRGSRTRRPGRRRRRLGGRSASIGITQTTGCGSSRVCPRRQSWYSRLRTRRRARRSRPPQVGGIPRRPRRRGPRRSPLNQPRRRVRRRPLRDRQ